MEGWWVTLAFSGLSLSLGVLVWMIQRDRARTRHKREAATRKMLEDAYRDGDLTADQLERLERRSDSREPR